MFRAVCVVPRKPREQLSCACAGKSCCHVVLMIFLFFLVKLSKNPGKALSAVQKKSSGLSSLGTFLVIRDAEQKGVKAFFLRYCGKGKIFQLLF